MFALRSLRRLIVHVANIPYHVIMILVALHMTVSYALLSLANETHLVEDVVTFIYFWVVSSSTVGYGDLSPATQAGKIFVCFMIPTSLLLFSMILTKFGKSALHSFNMVQKGMLNLEHKENHILIMGYKPIRTDEIISLILSDKSREPRDIVVVCDEAIDNPFLNRTEIIFCKLEDMINETQVKRCGLKNAHKIIVDGGDDYTNYVHSARYSRMAPHTHITTCISNTTLADDISAAYNNVEVIVDYSEELAVRAMQDCGTSRVFNEMLDGRVGQNMYSTAISLPVDATFGDIEKALAESDNASLIAIANDPMGKSLQLNPPKSLSLKAGETYHLHYINAQRINADKCIEMLKEMAFN
jgi:voltage-gated potassium channel